ncbi:MAG: Spy/CpxP family protein refolding chaperone [Desulfomonilaceae bacterium]
MRRIIAALIAVGVIFFGATSLFAAGPELGKDRDKVQERIETLTMWKLIEALDLDQATADKLLEMRHKFLSQRKSLQKGLSEDFRTLRKQLSDPAKPADEKELARLLEDIRKNRKQLQGLREQQYEDVSKVLTVRQRAQLVLFFKDFRKELRSLLRPSQAPEGMPEKGMGPPRGGLGSPDMGMGLPPGAAGLGEKGSRPPRLAPGPPARGTNPPPDPPGRPPRLDEAEGQ